MNTLSLEDLEAAASGFRLRTSGDRGLSTKERGDRGSAHTAPSSSSLEDVEDQRVAESLAMAERREAMIDDFNARMSSNAGAGRGSRNSMHMMSTTKDASATLSALHMSRRASSEAADEQLRLRYEKKLRRFEKDFLRVQQAYKDQLVAKQAALEECRAELEREKESRLKLEREFSEELTLKDRRMHRLQGDVGTVGVYRKKCLKWERYAEQLATAVIHACATSRPLPTGNTGGGPLMGAFKGAFESLTSAPTHSRRHVIVERAGLIRGLKLSKAIVHRLGLEQEARAEEQELGHGNVDPNMRVGGMSGGGSSRERYVDLDDGYGQDPADMRKSVVDEAEDEYTDDGDEGSISFIYE